MNFRTQRIICVPFRNRANALSFFPFALPLGAPPKPPTKAEFERSRGREKLLLAGPYYQHLGQETWRAWQHAPPQSLKHRAFALAQSALVRLSPSEAFFKAVDLGAERVAVQYAADDFQPQLIVDKLRAVVRVAPARHFRLMLVSGITVPFAALFLTALPGPNVFLYWAAFRTYSHYAAWQGARHLASLLAATDDADADNAPLTFVPAPHLAAAALGTPPDLAQLLTHFPDAPHAQLALSIAQATRRK
jgi:hypothetical protein